jgi:hypothetical protein
MELNLKQVLDVVIATERVIDLTFRSARSRPWRRDQYRTRARPRRAVTARLFGYALTYFVVASSIYRGDLDC